jgi:hypothetical protein
MMWLYRQRAASRIHCVDQTATDRFFKVIPPPYDRRFAAAVVSFARDADPQVGAGTAWPLYQAGTPTSVRWSADGQGNASLGAVPKQQQLQVWDSVLGF